MEDFEKELENLLSLFVSTTKPLPYELDAQVKKLKDAIIDYAEAERADAYDSGLWDGESDISWQIDDARDEGYAAGYADAEAEFSKDD